MPIYDTRRVVHKMLLLFFRAYISGSIILGKPLSKETFFLALCDGLSTKKM